MLLLGVAWKIAQAKAEFAEVVRRAQKSPQIILRRNVQVAAVVGGRDLEMLQARRLREPGPTLADSMADVRAAAASARWELQVPPRRSRSATSRRGRVRKAGPA